MRIVIDPLRLDDNGEPQPQVVELDTEDEPVRFEEAISEEQFEELKRNFMINHLIRLTEMILEIDKGVVSFAKRVHRAGILLPGEQASDIPEYIAPNPGFAIYSDRELREMSNRYYQYYGDRRRLEDSEVAERIVTGEIDREDSPSRELERREAIRSLTSSNHVPVSLRVFDHRSHNNAGMIAGMRLEQPEISLRVDRNKENYLDLPRLLSGDWTEQFDPPALAALVAQTCKRDIAAIEIYSNYDSLDQRRYYSSNADGSVVQELDPEHARKLLTAERLKKSTYYHTSEELANIQRALIIMIYDRIVKDLDSAEDLRKRELANLGVLYKEDLRWYLENYGNA